MQGRRQAVPTGGNGRSARPSGAYFDASASRCLWAASSAHLSSAKIRCEALSGMNIPTGAITRRRARGKISLAQWLRKPAVPAAVVRGTASQWPTSLSDERLFDRRQNLDHIGRVPAAEPDEIEAGENRQRNGCCAHHLEALRAPPRRAPQLCTPSIAHRQSASVRIF